MALDLNQVCDQHADRAACPDAMIAELRGGYGLYVRDGENGYGSSVIEIGYCPWCGANLPPIGDHDQDAASVRGYPFGCAFE
jgi:hypothetical protein